MLSKRVANESGDRGEGSDGIEELVRWGFGGWDREGIG